MSKLTGSKLSWARKEVKTYYGLHPYNQSSNICRGDAVYAQSITNKYGMTPEEIAKDIGIWEQVCGEPLKQEVAEPTQPVKKTRTPKSVVDKVDEALELDAQIKELSKKLKELRNEIEPYMRENNVKEIVGKNGAVALQPRNMALVTAQYTTYSTDVLDLMSAKDAKEAKVILVDREKVEALDKLGRLSSSPEQYRIYNSVEAFTFKH